MANERSSGMGIGGVLLVVFITLKLCHVIDWEWFWVISPLWVPCAVLGVVLVVVLIGAAIIVAWGGRK